GGYSLFRNLFKPSLAAFATVLLLTAPVVTGLSHAYYTELLFLLLGILSLDLLIACLSIVGVRPSRLDLSSALAYWPKVYSFLYSCRQPFTLPTSSTVTAHPQQARWLHSWFVCLGWPLWA